MPRRLVHTLLIVGLSAATAASGQDQNARDRARAPYLIGLEEMRAEAFDEAARSFERATREDPTFEMAHYMLGRAHLALKAYASAVRALGQARALYLADAGQDFQERQVIDRRRRERITDLDSDLTNLRAMPNQSYQVRERIRQLEEYKRQLEDRDRVVNTDTVVPAYVSLSLGSAHFRSGNIVDAEKAWRESVEADPRNGEGFNNLAVVYLETGRYDEAQRAVESAEKVGLAVQPALKEQIRQKRRAGRS